jgi:hypothetical protein
LFGTLVSLRLRKEGNKINTNCGGMLSILLKMVLFAFAALKIIQMTTELKEEELNGPNFFLTKISKETLMPMSFDFESIN